MLKKIFFIGACCLMSAKGYAQQNNSDSALTNTKTEPLVSFSEIRKSETNNKKGILKFNILGTMLNGLDVSYERKIAPKWSLNVSSITSFQVPAKNTYILAGSDWASKKYTWNTIDFAQNFSFQVRYYHNLERRKRLGKNTHFSGNYFAFETSIGYNRYNKSVVPFISSTSGNNFVYAASFLYGIQRQIGKRAYFDANLGIGVKHYQIGQYKENFISPSIKVGVGIAF